MNVRDLRRMIAAEEVLAFYRSDGWGKVACPSQIEVLQTEMGRFKA